MIFCQRKYCKNILYVNQNVSPEVLKFAEFDIEPTYCGLDEISIDNKGKCISYKRKDNNDQNK